MKYFWHPCQVQSVHICLASFGQLHVYIPTSLNLKLVLAACNGDQQIMVSTASNKAMSQPHIYMHGYICLAKKGFDLEGNFVEMQKMLEHLYNLHVFIYVNEIVVEQTHVNGGIL